MDNYKSNLKNYSCDLKKHSIILRLLDIGKCNSLKEVREIISNCKWEKKDIVDVLNFNSEELTTDCELYSSSIFIETESKIKEIITNQEYYDIITESDADLNLYKYGYSIYINYNDKKVILGNILNVNRNIITIKSELKLFELEKIKSSCIIIEFELYSVKIYNKGTSTFIPVIRLNDGGWAYDCVIDKRTYENDNKLCFNLLDDLNPANACGIISIGLIGALIGKVTHDTFKKKKKKIILKIKKFCYLF